MKKLKLNKKTKESVAVIVATLSIVWATGGYIQVKTNSSTTVQAEEGDTSATVSAEVSPTPTPEPETVIIEEIVEETDQYNEMKNIVIETFGEHSDKALKLLTCENRSLDPNAVNDNRTWGGVGRDLGLFQVNEFWQGIRHEGKAEQFLFDPEINVRIAWRLFEDSGYSFHMWTCGKTLGI
jgi:hypothetical protein